MLKDTGAKVVNVGLIFPNRVGISFPTPIKSIVNFLSNIWKPQFYRFLTIQSHFPANPPQNRHFFTPVLMSRIFSVPERLGVVGVDLLEKPDTTLPADSSSAAESPVETKGYKNIVKLPDWLCKHNISGKTEKPCQNG
ncbi:MAG: hypothetical protein Q7V05_06715 [Methanoregula sp.]|nr:hypothetical protein [Methanoregula sp.]